jgi:Glycosyl hydrolases family 43
VATGRARRRGVGVVVAVVVGLVVAGVVDDAQLQWRLHESQDQLATTRAAMNRTTDRLSSDTASARAADDGRRLSERRLGQVTAEIAAAEKMLAQARSGVASGTIELGDVHDCAGGVDRSVSALQAGDQPEAVAALSSVAAACENAMGSGSGGPVYPFDFADPDILVSGGTYFAYGTNATAGNIQIMESADLVHWTKLGDALPTLASWATPGDTWAPAVIHLKRSYVLYYTAAVAGSKVQCLSVATARRPQGPFTDSTTKPLECQPTLGGSIDPSPYVDGDGQPYLTWKSNGGDGQPATIWAQALDPQGTALVGTTPSALLRPTQPWEGSVVEAPAMVAVDGSYWLFYSGNNWDSAHYAVGVARCAGVLGPCVTALAGPLLASGPDFEGPGGEAVFTDDQGGLEMAFHAWLPGAVGYPHMRLLFVRPVVMADGVPRVEPPG